jgi:NAD dependent epimerase/dehydratase family
VVKAGREVVDLRDQLAVEVWLKQNRPEAIVFAAAKVGGIYANDTFPADFIYDNLAIEANVIHSAHLAGVDRLVFMGSSCIYPKFAPQPIKETRYLPARWSPRTNGTRSPKLLGLSSVKPIESNMAAATFRLCHVTSMVLGTISIRLSGPKNDCRSLGRFAPYLQEAHRRPLRRQPQRCDHL